MRREDCIETFTKIPEGMLPYVNLVLRNGFSLAVSTVARFEDQYIVFSGREGGTADENRGFFVPYTEISYIRIEKAVRVGELKTMYGETGYEDLDDRLAAQSAESEKKSNGPVPPPIPVPVMPSDPASIARQNLLDRIRAARALAGTTGKLAGK